MGSWFSSAMYSTVTTPATGDSTAIRRNPKYKDELVQTAFPEVRTLYDCFQCVRKNNRAG